jgi:hypothetical protein
VKEEEWAQPIPGDMNEAVRPACLIRFQRINQRTS